MFAENIRNFFIEDAIYTIPTVAVDIYVFDMPSTTIVGETVRNIRAPAVIPLLPYLIFFIIYLNALSTTTE
jgi:hypothetical protein